MRQEYIDEVLHAAFHAIGENQTLVSRHTIELHILRNHTQYPALFSHSQCSRRTKISCVMNARFPLWIQGRGVNQNNFVWKIRDIGEDDAGVF